MLFTILAQVDQGWRDETPISFESVIGGIVVLGVASFFLKKWSNFCDRTFEKKTKMGMAVFLSPFVAFTAYWAYRITDQARFHIGGEPAITFIVWFLLVGVGVAFWLGLVSAIAEMFK
jgi:hypothetical protein